MPFIGRLEPFQRPAPVAWYFATTEERDGLSEAAPGVSLSAGDVGRMCRVGESDPYSYFELVAISPIEWVPVSLGLTPAERVDSAGVDFRYVLSADGEGRSYWEPPRAWRVGYNSSRTYQDWAKIVTVFITEARQNYKISVSAGWSSLPNSVDITLAATRGNGSSGRIYAFDYNLPENRDFDKIGFTYNEEEDSYTVYIRMRSNYKDVDAAVVVGTKYIIHSEEKVPDQLPEGGMEGEFHTAWNSRFGIPLEAIEGLGSLASKSQVDLADISSSDTAENMAIASDGDGGVRWAQLGRLESFTAETLPASPQAGRSVFLVNPDGGGVPIYYSGSEWLYYSDNSSVVTS